jgi:hypothetical protein
MKPVADLIAELRRLSAAPISHAEIACREKEARG